MSDRIGTLYEFMPYGAPELKEVAQKYMVRAVLVASGAWVLIYMLSFGTSFLLAHRPFAGRGVQRRRCRFEHRLEAARAQPESDVRQMWRRLSKVVLGYDADPGDRRHGRHRSQW